MSLVHLGTQWTHNATLEVHWISFMRRSYYPRSFNLVSKDLKSMVHATILLVPRFPGPKLGLKASNTVFEPIAQRVSLEHLPIRSTTIHLSAVAPKCH